MVTQEQLTTQEQMKPTVTRSGGGMDAVYGIGMIGGWVFYFKRAAPPQDRDLALLKGFAWDTCGGKSPGCASSTVNLPVYRSSYIIGHDETAAICRF